MNPRLSEASDSGKHWCRDSVSDTGPQLLGTSQANGKHSADAGQTHNRHSTPLNDAGKESTSTPEAEANAGDNAKPQPHPFERPELQSRGWLDIQVLCQLLHDSCCSPASPEAVSTKVAQTLPAPCARAPEVVPDINSASHLALFDRFFCYPTNLSNPMIPPTLHEKHLLGCDCGILTRRVAKLSRQGSVSLNNRCSLLSRSRVALPGMSHFGK